MKKMKISGFYVTAIIFCFVQLVAEDLEQKTEQTSEQVEQKVLPTQDTVLSSEQNAPNAQEKPIVEQPKVNTNQTSGQNESSMQDTVPTVSSLQGIISNPEENGINKQVTPIIEHQKIEVEQAKTYDDILLAKYEEWLKSLPENAKIDLQKKYDDVVNKNMVYYYRKRQIRNTINEYYDNIDDYKKEFLIAYEMDNRSKIKEMDDFLERIDNKINETNDFLEKNKSNSDEIDKARLNRFQVTSLYFD